MTAGKQVTQKRRIQSLRHYPTSLQIKPLSIRTFARIMHRSRIRWTGFFICCAILIQPFSICADEEYQFDISEIDKKPYHLGGYIEINPVLFGLNQDSRFYRLKLYDRNKGSTLEQYGFTLQLEGSYEKGPAAIFARVNSNLRYTYEGWSDQTDLYEGFLSFKPFSSLTLDIGKKTLKWGKGYAWNPAAFLDRSKDPDDPDLNLEGFVVVSMDYTKSFNSPLKTFSFSPVLIPVYDEVNEDFGEPGYLNMAAKFYFLFLDTDIDVMFLSNGSKSLRYGFTFSRNITSNFEIHGEMAWIEDTTLKSVDQEGRLDESRCDSGKYLLGLRYLSKIESTYILEYYHNDTGFSERDMGDYFSFVDNGYKTYCTTGNDKLLKKGRKLAEERYGKPTPMRDYLYLRISQKEPFDILYFTPAMTWLFNLNDQSCSFSPELVYTGITNLEMRLKGVVFAGKHGSEFGEKQNDYRLELRLRYYF